MKRLKMMFAALSVMTLAVAPAAFAQTVDQDIERLIRVSGTAQTMEQTFDMMIRQFQTQFGGMVPANVWDGVRQRINVNEFLAQFVPIYRRHYTQEEIRELIRFYESPIGQKTVRIMPQIMEESMAIGARLGEQIGAEIMGEMMR